MRAARWTLVGVLAGLTLGSPRAVEGADYWDRLVRSYVKHSHYLDTDGPDAGPENLALHFGKQGRSATEIAQTFATRFHMSEEAATVFLHAFLEFEADIEHEVSTDHKASSRRLRSMEALFREALRLAPDNPQVLQKVGSFYDNYDERLPGFPAQVISLQNALPVPGDAAIILAGQFQEPAAFRILEAALARHPDHPWLLAAMAAEATTLDRAAALHQSATFAAVRVGWSGREPRLVAYLAEQWIETLLEAGLTGRALDAYRALPLETQEILKSGASAVLEGRIDGLRFHADLRDFRAELAGAWWLQGDREAARDLGAWRGAARDIDASLELFGPHAQQGGRTRTHRLAILRALESPDDDAFGVVVAVLRNDRDDRPNRRSSAEVPGSGALRSIAWRRLFVELLRREGNLDAAKEIVDDTVYALRHSYRASLPPPPAPPKGTGETWVEIHTAIEDTVAGLEREMEALAASTERTRPPDPLAHAVGERLARPRLVPFIERPLPSGVRPVGKVDTAALRKTQEELVGRSGFPSGYDPVRVESDGPRVGVIAASQNYDPVGEISPGGYWFLESKDGGTTWLPALYTGLRTFAPYVVRPVSRLPLFDADHLHLEVDLKELDEESISFPPVMMRTKREKSRIYLDIPLSELRKDSDGDGLTDLAEERLLTDPVSPDSDVDGTPDGDDLLPLLAPDGAPSPLAGAVAASLNEILGSRIVGIIEPLQEDVPDAIGGWKRPAAGGARVLFVLGDRTNFRGLDAGIRMVILSESEWEKACTKFGRTLPLHFPTLLWNRARDRAYFVWSEGWRGGSTILEKRGHEWVARSLSSWVS